MIDQIKKLMDSKNLSPTQFSEEIGIQRSSLSHVLSGRNKPSLDFMMKIKSRYPDTNLDWLLLGVGEMKDTLKSENMAVNEIVIEEVRESKSEESLFSEIRQEEISKSETDTVMIESEEKVSAKSKLSVEERNAEKVIILYSDQTFSVYKQKG